MNTSRSDRPRHVLVLPSWYPTRRMPLSGTFFRSQVRALRDAGLRTGVIYPEIIGLRAYLRAGRPATTIVCEDDDGIPTYRRLTVPFMPRFSRRNAWFWLRAGESLFAAYIRDHGRPDLIHAHSSLYGGVLANRIATRFGIPYLITEHHTAFARGRVRRWTQRLVGLAFAAASARLVVSRQLGLQLTAQFADRFCPWHIVPNVLDRHFEEPLDDRPTRDPAEFRYFCIGTFNKRKAQDLLITAFSRAAGGDESLRLLFAGEGGTEPDCRQLARTLGLADRVEFLGSLDRGSIRRQLLSTDVLVLPSYYETFGVVAIEALACGVPVIATRCGGPEDIIDEGNGLLVPAGDVGALAGALTRMRDQIGRYHPRTLQRDSLARYSAGAIAGLLAGHYEAILADAGAAPPAEAGQEGADIANFG